MEKHSQGFRHPYYPLTALLFSQFLLTASGCGWIACRHFSASAYGVDQVLTTLPFEEVSTGSPQELPNAATEVLQEVGEQLSADAPPLYPEFVQLTLQDARTAALEGNLDLIVANFDPDLASQRVYQEIWQFESTFEGTLSRNRMDPAPTPFATPSPEVGVDVFNPAIVIPFLTGGRMSFKNSATRTQFPGASGVFGPNIHDLAPTLSYTQPLLRNGGKEVNTARIQFAQLNRGRADAATKLTAIRVVAETERAYWILLAAQKNFEIASQQVSIAEDQMAAARKLADAGIVTQVDVLRSESGLNARREVVVRAERDLLLSIRELKRVMQAPELPVESTTSIEVVSTPNLTGLTFDRELLADNALSLRMEMIDLALQVAQQSVNLRVAENAILPELNFIFEGKLLGNGSTDGAAARQAWGEDHEAWFTGLTFSVPIAGNQTARRRARERELSLAQTVASQARLEVAIVSQINDAVDRFEKNWERIGLAYQTVVVAEQTYQAETRLFELGQRTSDLVLRAAGDLANAQLQLVQSIVDFQLSRIDIAVSTGTVLGYSGIAFTDKLPDEQEEEILPPVPAMP